jgi:hypothetical protein
MSRGGVAWLVLAVAVVGLWGVPGVRGKNVARLMVTHVEGTRPYTTVGIGLPRQNVVARVDYGLGEVCMSTKAFGRSHTYSVTPHGPRTCGTEIVQLGTVILRLPVCFDDACVKAGGGGGGAAGRLNGEPELVLGLGPRSPVWRHFSVGSYSWTLIVLGGLHPALHRRAFAPGAQRPALAPGGNDLLSPWLRCAFNGTSTCDVAGVARLTEDPDLGPFRARLLDGSGAVELPARAYRRVLHDGDFGLELTGAGGCTPGSAALSAAHGIEVARCAGNFTVTVDRDAYHHDGQTHMRPLGPAAGPHADLGTVLLRNYVVTVDHRHARVLLVRRPSNRHFATEGVLISLVLTMIVIWWLVVDTHLAPGRKYRWRNTVIVGFEVAGLAFAVYAFARYNNTDFAVEYPGAFLWIRVYRAILVVTDIVTIAVSVAKVCANHGDSFYSHAARRVAFEISILLALWLSFIGDRVDNVGSVVVAVISMYMLGEVTYILVDLGMRVVTPSVPVSAHMVRENIRSFQETGSIGKALERGKHHRGRPPRADTTAGYRSRARVYAFEVVLWVAFVAFLLLFYVTMFMFVAFETTTILLQRYYLVSGLFIYVGTGLVSTLVFAMAAFSAMKKYHVTCDYQDDRFFA